MCRRKLTAVQKKLNKNMIDVVERVSRNPLIEVAKEFKNPSVRFILIAAVFIMSALSGVIVYQQRTTIGDKNERIAELENEIKKKDAKIDSLTITQYHFVLDRLNQSEKVNEFKNSWDSLNNELTKIQKTLTPK